MPRVSVVIPAYNAARLLGQTLESVTQQRYDDYGVVVIDDGSTDGTADVARRYGPRVQVVSQANAGMSASRNRGADATDSEFIALVDSDDIWHPDKLRLQVAALDARADTGFCFTKFNHWDGSDTAAFLAEPRVGGIDEAMSGWVYHHLVLVNRCLPSSMLFRRSAWQALGPFRCDDQQTDDWEYILRSSQRYRYVRLAESMVLYRAVASSLSRRLRRDNNTELMREQIIGRFGLRSPDGTEVDARELARLRYLGWSNFADAHCARGELGLGLATFGRLLLRGPSRAESALRLAKALRRRVFPKAA
jgi:glycosyltransferase involved in cell wall biosynthesis